MHFIDTHQDRARCALRNGTSIGHTVAVARVNVYPSVSLTLINTPPEVHVVYCSLHVDHYTRLLFQWRSEGIWRPGANLNFAPPPPQKISKK